MKNFLIIFVSFLIIAQIKAEFNFRSLYQCSKTFCGGIGGLRCCQGYECYLDGNYPDAGGKCINLGQGCVMEGGICGGFAGTICCSGGCNYRPGADYGYC